MSENIISKTKLKHKEYVNKNIYKVLNSFSEKNNGCSVAEVLAILVDYLSKNLLNKENAMLANEISKEISLNENLSSLFKKVDSAYLNGIILSSVGLSLMNLDKFADEIINESIDKGEFFSNDLDILKSYNVKNIKKSTLDRVNNYLVTGEKNIPLKKKEVKANKCNCENCTCKLNKKENKYDREEAIKMLSERMAAINYSKDKLNDNVIEISDDDLFLLVLKSLIK